jgi:hypothetical protein
MSKLSDIEEEVKLKEDGEKYFQAFAVNLFEILQQFTKK